MAVIRCGKCGKNISSNLPECPFCGSPAAESESKSLEKGETGEALPKVAYCAKCGMGNEEQASHCMRCGEVLQKPVKYELQAEYSPAIRAILPVQRSGYAIAAGYAGLCCLIPCLGVVAAPTALTFGFIALSVLKKNPKKLGKGRAIFGIVMGAITALLYVGFLLRGVFR